MQSHFSEAATSTQDFHHSRGFLTVSVTCWLFSTPLALLLYFLYPHTVDIVQILSLGVFMCSHFVFNHAVYFKLWFIFFCELNLMNT
jgi:hypothetical protein